MGRPELRLTSVTVAAPDPRALAAFYAALLGCEVAVSEPARPGMPPEDGWAQLRAPGGPTLNFEYEQGYVAPVWPSAPGQQQLQEHLDIAVQDLRAAVEWAVSLGARVADAQPQDDVRVLLDPAGHPFCLFLG